VGIPSLVYYAVYKLGLATGYFAFMERMEARTGREIRQPIELFQFPSADELSEIIGDPGKTELLYQAQEIVDGKFRLFGSDLVDIKLSLGKPLLHWSVYEKDPNLLRELISPDSDIKFTWEPARFGWAYKLGYAYHLTGEQKYCESFWKYFEEFDSSNPAFVGPQWMNGQEAAIRLMVLLWTSQLFSSCPVSTPHRKQRLASSIYEHSFRISLTLSYARAQNNNHLITEAAALFGAGTALQVEKWRTAGWRWLNWAFQNQIGGYGEYIQHSTNYHRLMLQAALWVTAIVRNKKRSWPLATERSLARAAHWLFSMIDPLTGKAPNLGANDGALILPLSVEGFDHYQPTVQAAARAFLRSQLPKGSWDDLSAWLGIPPAAKTYQSDDYLVDNLHGKKSWAYLRASRLRSRLSHMDQLHLDLWWQGSNMTQDAGTYSYHAEPPWDNPFVATRVHNTVTLDGRDQMRRGGRFITLDWFPAYSSPVIEPDENILQKIKAYHRGYGGVLHERSVSVFVDERWLVEDRLSASKPHTYRLHWLLPDWEWDINQEAPGANSEHSGVVIRLKNNARWVLLVVNAYPQPADLSAMLTMVRSGVVLYGHGSVSPIDGWLSPTYGEKKPALSIAVETPGIKGLRFTSEFIFPR
jgi:hypothetical protein